MKKLITGTFALGLMLAAASCGSSATKSSDATTVTVASSVASSATSAAASTGTMAAPDVSGLTPTQAQVFTMNLADAASAGVTLDPACFKKAVAQLSEADAKLIVAAGPGGTPTLSPAGEDVGKQAQACAVDSTTATTPGT